MTGEPAPGAPLVPVEAAACGLCGGGHGRPYAVTYDYEYGTSSNRWQFIQCDDCETLYLNPRPSPDALGVIYPPTYYSYRYEEEINAVARRAKEFMDRRTLRWMLHQLEVPLQAYLDVGCGSGRALRTIASFGLPRTRIYGTELDEPLVRRLCREGFQVEATTIEHARTLPEGQFQLITLFSVLEHVAEPRLILEKGRSLLSPGGLLVAEVPNPRSLNARLFRDRYWGGYHAPRHFNIFPIDAVGAAAARVGLRLKTARRTTGHAFWLFSLHHFVRYELGWERVGKWLHPARCLPGVALATAVDLIRARLGGETDNWLIVLERPTGG